MEVIPGEISQAQFVQLLQIMGEEGRELTGATAEELETAMLLFGSMPQEIFRRYMQTATSATAATAQQLGSMSLGESAERAEPGAEKAKAGEAQAKFCSSCGKNSDALKTCNGCKCVWYCDKICQMNHRRDHKEECRRVKTVLDKRGGNLDIGTELDLGLPLPDLPPQEECPICMRCLPLQKGLLGYSPCCGKIVCGACDYQHSLKSGGARTCAFCREPVWKTNEEGVAQLSKRVELKDPNAMVSMGIAHGFGQYGLQVDQANCIELLCECADLGFPSAQYNLGNFHHRGEMGLDENKEEGLKYLEAAANGGHILARHNLGCTLGINGDAVAAMRHLRLAASGGSKLSTGNLIGYFERAVLHHGDLAETMRAFYRSRAELKSDDRDQYIEYLKKIGQYKEEYEM